MSDFWQTVRDLLEGLAAIKAGAETYLPRHPVELDEDYKYRLSCGYLTNIFADTIDTLSAKPFDQECHIIDDSASVAFIGDPIMVADSTAPGKKKDSGKRKGGFQENVDGKGSHLHVFAKEVFKNGIANSLDWIFVDYPKVPAGLTQAEEDQYNIRPYWYRVPALNVLEVQSAMVGGKEEFVYMRLWEQTSVKNGWSVEVRERVREITREKTVDKRGLVSYGMPEFVVWERDPSLNVTKEADRWKKVDSGVYTIGVIPLVPFITGHRRGTSWQFDPSMRTCVDLQIKLYQQETGLENVTNLVNYPMLSAVGINLNDAEGNQVEITMGPHTILSAPPSPDGSGTPGRWEFISPASDGLKFSLDRTDKTKEELREAGRQPLTANSQNITVVTSAFAAGRANSAVQAWALSLKDTLENALDLTAKWMNEPSEPEVFIFTDFPTGTEDESFEDVLTMREKGDLSRRTVWKEAKRRGKLAPEFDPDAEDAALADEVPSGDGDDEGAVDA